MNEEQKHKLIMLISEMRDAALVYGSVAEKVQGGEYIRQIVIEARQKDLDNTMQAILDYIKTI